MNVETKFNPGDEVWTMHQNKPHSFRISTIEISLYGPGSPMSKYGNSEVYVELIHTGQRNNPQHLRFSAKECYPSKEALCKALFSDYN